MSFINELKRRNVVRVSIAYGVLSWLLLQVSDVVFGLLELPVAWSHVLLALLAIGFIPVLVFAWVYEMTPEGLKKESEIPRDQSITAHTAKRLDLAVIVLLVLAIGLFLVDRFAFRPASDSPPQLTAEQTVPAAEGDAPVSSTGPATGRESEPADATPVVAVLPFNTLSTEDEGTFLASGLHDDLLTRLAKLQAFKVISRTSVMDYRGTTKNIRQIGQELGAGYIVEGGLQYIGGRVSINAQLIDAGSDEHKWAETFTRELTAANLFDVQAEIAGAIATALHATLSPTDRETLEAVPTQSLAAYRAYLKGLETNNLLDRPSMQNSIEQFSEAVRLDPEFAEAWAQLSGAYLRIYWEEGAEDALAPDFAWRDLGGEALARAETLDPENVEVLLARVKYLYYGNRDYAGALHILGQAEARAPHHEEVIAGRGFLLRRLGRLDEAADAILSAMEINPNANNSYKREALLTLRIAGRCEEAVELGTKWLAGAPESNELLRELAWVAYQCQDDVATSQALMERTEVTTLEELEGVMNLLEAQGNYAALVSRVETERESLIAGTNLAASLVIDSELAWFYRQTGQSALSEQALQRAAAAAEGLPENSYVLIQRGLIAGLQGQRDEAERLGREAEARFPDDALLRSWSEYGLVRMYAIAGARDAALDQMDSLAKIATSEDWLRLERDPSLDSLREEPRFQAALAQAPQPRGLP